MSEKSEQTQIDNIKKNNIIQIEAYPSGDMVISIISPDDVQHLKECGIKGTMKFELHVGESHLTLHREREPGEEEDGQVIEPKDWR